MVSPHGQPPWLAPRGCTTDCFHCFLIYSCYCVTVPCRAWQEEVGQGTLFMNWSESAVDGAIAFFKPGKKVAPPTHPTHPTHPTCWEIRICPFHSVPQLLGLDWSSDALHILVGGGISPAVPPF